RPRATKASSREVASTAWYPRLRSAVSIPRRLVGSDSTTRTARSFTGLPATRGAWAERASASLVPYRDPTRTTANHFTEAGSVIEQRTSGSVPFDPQMVNLGNRLPRCETWESGPSDDEGLLPNRVGCRESQEHFVGLDGIALTSSVDGVPIIQGQGKPRREAVGRS